MRTLAALALAIVMAVPAFAVNPDEMLADPVLEARARSISEGLRCLVCQNESIDESNADLARELRILVRERLAAGDSDEQAVDFIVARYGEYVLLQPVVAPHTILLWSAAPLILVVGAVAILIGLRRRKPASAPEALSPEEQAILDDLDSTRR
jgi:cytochrome c-type biogenesis protein CcmH